jgi:hypothetical protein
MIRKTLTSLALVAGCTIALAVPVAQAQTVDTQILMNAPRVNPGDRADWMAGSNNAESAQYDRLMGQNRALRPSRTHNECGSISNAHLRAGCMEGRAFDEDRRSMGLREGLTGDSSGRMNSIDRTFQGPEKYDPRLGR